MNGTYLMDTQLYALFFIVGAFTVKSLFEMKNWASRKNMWELWVVFLIVFVIHDAVLRPYRLRELGSKWAIISGLIVLFYIKEIGFIVRDDKLALLAALSILPMLEVGLVVLVYAALILVLKKRLKHEFSHTNTVPTMPIMTTSLITVVLISIFVIG